MNAASRKLFSSANASKVWPAVMSPAACAAIVNAKPRSMAGRREGDLAAAADRARRARAAHFRVGETLTHGRPQVELGLEVFEVEREVEDGGVRDGARGLRGRGLARGRTEQGGTRDAEAERFDEGAPSGFQVDGPRRRLSVLGIVVQVEAASNQDNSPLSAL